MLLFYLVQRYSHYGMFKRVYLYRQLRTTTNNQKYWFVNKQYFSCDSVFQIIRHELKHLADK